jgi:hypothetical protein
MKKQIVSLFFVLALGCSSTSSPSDPLVDAGGDSAACVLSGTYAAGRFRSSTAPGSCPADYSNFTENTPIRITAVGGTTGYQVDVGYTDGTGKRIFVTCTSNVSGCTVYATCKPDAGTDQATFTLSGDTLTGTISRTTTTGCTVNFTISGGRA